MMLELNKLFTHTIESNIIPSRAFRELYHRLKDDVGMTASKFLNDLFSWDNESSPWAQWMITDKSSSGGYTGTWPKRFASALYKNCRIKLDDETMDMIGNLVSKDTAIKNNKTMYFEISKKTNWKHGSFEPDSEVGAPGGCWWAAYNTARLGLEQHKDGRSVLFYRSTDHYAEYKGKRGIGRCWMFNVDGRPVIFNAYGPYSLSDIASALAAQMGVSSKKIKLSVPSVNGHAIAYINAGNYNNQGRDGGRVGIGYVIGKEQDIETLEHIELPDFRYRDITCPLCNKECVSSDCLRWDEKYICRDCAEERMFVCRSCGRHHPKVDVNYATVGTDKIEVCPRCLKMRGQRCDECGITLNNVFKIWHSQKQVCEFCNAKRERPITRCYGCGHYVEKYTEVHMPRIHMALCRSCTKKVDEAK